MDFVSYVLQNAPRYGLDPAAVIAVARTEGGLQNREDDRGDGGRSFGPHQLFENGALPAQFKGKPDAADAWAWSPAGFDYALRKMVEAGAAGQTGVQAIDTIVRKFERPAAPDAEVQKATGFYSAAPTGASATRQTADSRGSQLPEKQQKQIDKGIRELFYDPLGAYDEGNWIAPIGGHSDHVHVSFGTPDSALYAIKLAQQLGLRASENPYAEGSPAEPGVHTPTSYHYRTFPGLFEGKQLGQGLDVSGPAALMAKYFNDIRSRVTVGVSPTGQPTLVSRPAGQSPLPQPVQQPPLLPSVPKPPTLAAPEAPPNFLSSAVAPWSQDLTSTKPRLGSLVEELARSVFG